MNPEAVAEDDPSRVQAAYASCRTAAAGGGAIQVELGLGAYTYQSRSTSGWNAALASLVEKGDTAIRATQVPVTRCPLQVRGIPNSPQCPGYHKYSSPHRVSRALGSGYRSNSAPRSLQRNLRWRSSILGWDGRNRWGSVGWFLHWRLQNGIIPSLVWSSALCLLGGDTVRLEKRLVQL